MAASLIHLQARDPFAAVVAALHEHGGVVVEGLLGRDTLDRVNAEIDPLLAQVQPDRKFLNPAPDWFFGTPTRHITAVATKSRTFVTEVLTHPTLLGVTDAILGLQVGCSWTVCGVPGASGRSDSPRVPPSSITPLGRWSSANQIIDREIGVAHALTGTAYGRQVQNSGVQRRDAQRSDERFEV
jgi:hypothetical protein